MAYQNVFPIDEEEYHPIQGRFLRNKHVHIGTKNEASFNKLRPHDALLFKAKQSHNTSGGSNASPTAIQTCNCSSAKTSHQSRYPFSSFRDEVGDTFSIVILTYNRTDLLLRLLNHYSAMPHLERIVVVWNCQEMTAPVEEWAELGPHPVPVEFKVQQENRLRNRLQIFPDLKSSG